MDIACVRRDRHCNPCDRQADCPIARWYDPGRAGSSSPRPFALRILGTPTEANPTGQLVVEWSFLVAPPRPSLVVESLCRAARLGLGPNRVPHRVHELMVQGAGAPVMVLREDRQEGAWPTPAPLGHFVRLPEAPRGARLHLLSPLQLRGSAPPDAGAVLRAAVSRVRSIARGQGLRLDRWWPEPAGLTARWEGLRRVQGSRWSRRQAHAVDLTGWLGTLVLGPAVAAWADLLAAMEVLQLGRQTAAGLGRVTVSWEAD